MRETLADRYADAGKDLGGVLFGWGAGLLAAFIALAASGWLAAVIFFFLVGFPGYFLGLGVGWVAGRILGRLLDAMIHGE